jgi:hypothetical protein
MVDCKFIISQNANNSKRLEGVLTLKNSLAGAVLECDARAPLRADLRPPINTTILLWQLLKQSHGVKYHHQRPYLMHDSPSTH